MGRRLRSVAVTTESRPRPNGPSRPRSPEPAAEPGSGTLDRRAVIAGAVGTSVLGLAWLSGCSSGTTTGTRAGTTAGGFALTKPGASGKVLTPVFDASGGDGIGYVLTGTEQRLCFGLRTLADEPVLDGPETLTFTLTRDGKPVGAPIDVARHTVSQAAGYYPLRTTFTETGIYQATAIVAGEELSQALQVYAPSTSKVPARGEKLRPVVTPTTTDARGVVPICTRKPDPCPFHEISLTDALARGGPIAFLVSTPEFCQIGICGPVLEVLTTEAAKHPDVTVIHAEVYKDAEARRDFRQAELADVMNEYQLTFEPTLFLADASGIVVDRLDNVFDDIEIRAGLAAISSATASTTASTTGSTGGTTGSTTG